MVKKIKKGDYIVYGIFTVFFAYFSFYIFNLEDQTAEKAEIYINSQLKYVQNLQQEEKNIFLDTDIGGVNIQFKDMKVRVVTSYSPKQIAVKEGWISKPGELLIGVPDKMLIKIVGNEKKGDEEVDYVAK
ncbi:MAG: NusG domain II-containing protein [Fusobacteriaceae bacterium]